MPILPPIPLMAAPLKGARERTYPAGLYITPDTIYAIQFRLHGGILQIQHFGQIATPPASIAPQNGMIRDPQAMTFALHALWRQAGIKSKKVVATIWGSDLLVRQIDFPPMPENMLNETVLMSELERYPIFEGKTVVSDAFVIKKSDQSLQTCVGAIDKEVVESIRQVVDQAGLTLIGTDIAQFSFLRTLIASGDLSPTTDWGCLEILPGKIAISLWNRTNLLSWREADIEELHRNLLDNDDVEAVAQRIFLEVSRSLQVVGGFSPKRLLVACLSPTDAEWISQRLEAELGLAAYMPVAYKDLLGKVGTTPEGYFIAAGSSLWLHETFPPPLNFYKPKNILLQLQRSLDKYLPSINIPQHDISPVFKLSLGLSVASLIGIDLAKGYFKGEQQKLQQQIQDTQAQATQFQASSQDPELLRLKDTVLLVSKPLGWPIEDFLSLIREQIPHDTWLSNLTFDVGGSIKLDGASMTINSPLLFAYNLGQLERTRHVDLTKISRIKDGSYAFSLTIVLGTQTAAPATAKPLADSVPPGGAVTPPPAGTAPNAGMPGDSGPPRVDAPPPANPPAGGAR